MATATATAIIATTIMHYLESYLFDYIELLRGALLYVLLNPKDLRQARKINIRCRNKLILTFFSTEKLVSASQIPMWGNSGEISAE